MTAIIMEERGRVYMGFGFGYGKVILFNEHIVVYGIPSIVSAIGMRTTAEVDRTPGTGFVIKDNRPETPGYKTEKNDQQKDSTDRILKAAGIDTAKTGLRIILGGELLAASGVGASAASCTAIARALSHEFGLKLSDDEINKLAYEGEKGYHGTPSGIDNTAATYGGLIWFRKSAEGPVMERLKMSQPVEIVMGNTGIVTDTKEAVAAVRKRYDADKARYDAIFKSAGELAIKARKAIEANDLKALGQYMNENHKMLQDIGVSCKELDNLVNVARMQGAYGAKLTGGGLGGYMVALTPGKELQERVAKALQQQGASVLKTTI